MAPSEKLAQEWKLALHVSIQKANSLRTKSSLVSAYRQLIKDKIQEEKKGPRKSISFTDTPQASDRFHSTTGSALLSCHRPLSTRANSGVYLDDDDNVVWKATSFTLGNKLGSGAYGSVYSANLIGTKYLPPSALFSLLSS